MKNYDDLKEKLDAIYSYAEDIRLMSNNADIYATAGAIQTCADRYFRRSD